ncbi:serine/threonine-protein phosphatase CPPED1-like [Salvelinus fontinalis]|uniref:serine/threonine-protein phosphatase CPPED1-like n=1 Tax=Salvelinus fontinalis TaxID=8038 RepID=UPI002485B9B3|nr:serine/threonine-protein phosphatase CPPED1-like [Salvelinus fontinalis]
MSSTSMKKSRRNGEVHSASSFADLQLDLMKAWREGDCDGEGDEWAEEVQLTQQAVEAINKLCRRPKFMVLCGDMVHARHPVPGGAGAGLEGGSEGYRPLHPSGVCQ